MFDQLISFLSYSQSHRLIKYGFVAVIVISSMLTSTNLVINVARAYFDASARQPALQEDFMSRALVFCALGDIFIGIGAALVLAVFQVNSIERTIEAAKEVSTALVQTEYLPENQAVAKDLANQISK